MATPVTLLQGSTGLDNLTAAVRLKLDEKTGLAGLAEAVNVYIDDTGRVIRRRGKDLVVAGRFHSAFCKGGDAFTVQERTVDAAIMQLVPGDVPVGVRSGLSKFQHMGWAQVGIKIYYSNGMQNGYLENGLSFDWPIQPHVGAPTTRQFSGPPLGSDLEWFGGRMYIVDGRFVFYSEPFAVGKYDLARCFYSYGTDVKMIKSVKTGIFISDSERTYFIAGLEPGKTEQIKVLDCPAHAHSAAVDLIDADSFGLQNVGLCAVWSCDQGLCLGTPSGEVLVVTQHKLDYPKGSKGASLITNQTIINTIE